VRTGAADIDYFKFPALGFQTEILNDADAFEAFAERVGALRPILLHGLYPSCDLSDCDLKREFDFATMDRLLRLAKTPGVSLHPSSGKIAPEVNAIIENLCFLRERYAHLGFVSMENLDSLRFGPLIQPEVITRIVRESGCDFLLDISHAYCAARCLGMDLREYLIQLPLERVYEIHINGWAEKGGDIMCHVKINAQGYEILRELLTRCAPQIVTIEYGRHNDRIGCGCPVLRPDGMNAAAMDEITEQVRRVREIIDK
jgi:hypothetical protein